MSAPVLADAPPATLSFDWRTVLPPLALGLLLLGLLFHQEVAAAVHTWNDSTAYNHCFLVIPIALYLLWDRRLDLTGLPARPMPAALLLAIPLAAVWLFAERLGIMEGRQLVAMSFVQVLFLAVLGPRLWWAVAGPLLYLYFLVPFGDFLTPRLQDITTWFIRHGLDVLGVPAYIDGYVIEIPQGSFFVAEACAGLRFLIASIAFGTLYALVMYRSPVRRFVFFAVSIVVPIVANGFRGIGIVYLGYLLGSAKAAAADHIIYGWIFFSIVILILIALGLPFRQDEQSTRSTSIDPRPGPRLTLPHVATIALALVAIAAISPAVATVLALKAATQPAASNLAPLVRIGLAKDCQVNPLPDASIGGNPLHSEHLTCADTALTLSWTALSPYVTAAPLMAQRRHMVAGALTEDLRENWLQTPDAAPSPWRIMQSADPAYVTAVAVWVDGHPVRPSLTMRLKMAITSLTGAHFAPTIVTVTPVIDWKGVNPGSLRVAERDLTSFLRAHPRLIQTISASTALP